MLETKRKIRFKALTVGDNPKWVFGYYSYNGMTQKHTIELVDYFQSYTEEIDSLTLCQFIGAKDGVNNDIYENDVLSWEDKDGELHECVVVFDEHLCSFCLIKLHSMYTTPIIIGKDCDLVDLRVFDNKFN